MFRRLWTRIRCSQSGSVSPPLTRTTGDALRFLETQEKVSTWVTRLSSPMGVPGSVTPWSGPASKTTCTRPSGFVARLSAPGLPQGGDEGFLQQHQSQEDAVHAIRGLLGAIRRVVHGVEVTRVGLILKCPTSGGVRIKLSTFGYQARYQLIRTPSREVREGLSR